MTEKYTVQFITPKGVTLGSFEFNAGMTHTVISLIRNHHCSHENRVQHLIKPTQKDIEWSKEAGKVKVKAEKLMDVIEGFCESGETP